MDYRLKCKTRNCKLLEENIDRMLIDINCSNNFLDLSPKTKEIEVSNGT